MFGRLADGGANDTLALTGSYPGLLRVDPADHQPRRSPPSPPTSKCALFEFTVGPTTPDPPSLDAGSSKNWLWLAAAAVDMTNAADTISTTMPANYTVRPANLQVRRLDVIAAALVVAQRNLATQTEDPATFTVNNSRAWVAPPVAIPPSPASDFGDSEPEDAWHPRTTRPR